MKIRKRKANFGQMLRTAIALITSLPLILFVYFFKYDFAQGGASSVFFTWGTIFFVSWIIILELLLLYMLKIHIKAKHTLKEMQKKGMMEEPAIKSGVESLESVFNALSSRVKESFEELKQMSSKIESLNQELGKKVNVLLAIMQIHEVFTQGAREEEIFQFILDKLKEMLKLNKIKLLLAKTEQDKFNFTISSPSEDARVARRFDDEQLNTLTSLSDIIILDSHNEERNFSFLKKMLKLNNVFASPLCLRDEVTGFLIGGNCLDEFAFSKEDLGLINIFSKNIILLWEHRRLSQAVEGLEIYDPLTGLYNRKHLRTRLEEEIKRAVMYQRPCGLLLVELTNLKELQATAGIIETERLLKKTAQIFKETLRPIDIPGRLKENQIAAILIERNKRQCQTVVKKVKEVFEGRFQTDKSRLQFLFAVGENPLDGRNTEELLDYTSSNLKDYEKKAN